MCGGGEGGGSWKQSIFFVGEQLVCTSFTICWIVTKGPLYLYEYITETVKELITIFLLISKTDPSYKMDLSLRLFWKRKPRSIDS